MQYSLRYRRRLTKPPALPPVPVYPVQPLPLVIVEKCVVSASSEQR
jgi:hypothetical protein